MSQIRKAALGAIAITLTLSAAQLASGHDLVNRWQAASEQPSHIVNRAGKTDRLADLKPFAVPTKTVSMRLNDLADTSVLACEPVVSALTEVAKLLEPGRCVT